MAGPRKGCINNIEATIKFLENVRDGKVRSPADIVAKEALEVITLLTPFEESKINGT